MPPRRGVAVDEVQRGASPSSPAAAGEATNRSEERRGTRRLLIRVLIVQALTLVALYLLQLRFGMGAS